MMRRYLLIGWAILLAVAGYIYFFQPALLQQQLERAAHVSIYASYAIFLLIGSLRGFTLIPATTIIILGLLFFRPLPLYILTMVGITISSVSIYYFAELLRLDVVLKKKYAKQIYKITKLLERHELPIITIWAASPFLPTDLICYVCGTLRIGFKKFLFGIILGEGITCAMYIFFGHAAFEYIRASF